MVKRFIERFQLWREQRAAEFEDAPKITDYHLLYGYIGLALGFGVTALLLIIFTRGRLGYQHYRSERQARRPKIERLNETKGLRGEPMIPTSNGPRYRILIASIVILTVGVIVPQRSLTSAGEQQNVIHQLRIYEIFDSTKKAFHDRFRDHAMRIMVKYDFKIVATWESKKENRTEFIYLLEWPDKETMTDRWEKFMRDQEWIKIKKETGEVYGPLVGEIEDRTLHLTDYSPRKVLAK